MLVGPGTCSDKVSLDMCYQPVWIRLNVNNIIVVVWVDTMSGCAPEYNFVHCFLFRLNGALTT